MIKFTFEESELINNFFEGSNDQNKSTVIERLENAISNTEDKDLIFIAETTVNKILSMSQEMVTVLLQSLPIDINSNFF